jgi:hypothetical protein
MPGTIGRAWIGGPRQRHGAAARALRGASHGGFPVTPPPKRTFYLAVRRGITA